MALEDFLDRLAQQANFSANDRNLLRLEIRGLVGTRAQGAGLGQGAMGSQTIQQLVVTGDLDVPAGRVLIGQATPSKGNILLNAAGIQLRRGNIPKINLETDGDVFIGTDTRAPATTNLAIFTVAQTYNQENVDVGDLLLGDNSASKANMFWDKSTGTLSFRDGTTPTATIDTAGVINVKNDFYIQWYDASGSAGKGRIRYNASNVLDIYNATASAKIKFSITLTDASIPALDWDEDPGQVNRTHLVLNTGVQGGKLEITDGSALSNTVIQTAGSAGGVASATFPGAVNVGTGASTTAGNLTVSGTITNAALTSGRIAFAGASGLLKDDADLTFDGTDLAIGGTLTVGTVGTWTPVFAGSTTAGVYTYTNQDGYYIKLGGMVFIFGRVTISAIGTPPVGNMRITGLPFTVDASYFGSVVFGLISQFNYAAAALQLTALFQVGQAYVNLQEAFDNGVNVAVPAANFTNVACDLVFSGCYKI